jgi:type IV pilus assembly protein PilM
MLMKETVAGVDISAGGVAVACATPRRNGGLDVSHAGYAELPPAADTDTVASIVRDVWKKSRIPTYTVASCLNSGSLLLQYYAYQGLTEEETHSALRLEAEESLQTAAKNILYDVHEHKSKDAPATGSTQSREGVLVAAARSAVDDHRRLLKSAGLYPVVLDVGALAVCNLWLHLNSGAATGDVVFAVTLTRETAHLVIVAANGRVYPRTIVCGSGDWASSVDYLVDNITGQQEYAEAKLGMPRATRLLLTGELPGGAAFIEEVARRIPQFPVEGWSPMSDKRVRVASGVRQFKNDPDLAGRMTVSLGLALRGGDRDGV